MTEYALYEGDQYIFGGTREELAKYMGISPKTVKFMTSPTYLRRQENLKFKKNDARTIIRLEDEEEEQ